MCAAAALLLCATPCAAFTQEGDTPWPMPPHCVPTDPQIAYSTAADFLTFQRTSPPPADGVIRRRFTSGVVATQYPDPVSLNGSHVRALANVSVSIALDTRGGAGSIEAEFDIGEAARPHKTGVDMGAGPYDRNLAGHFRVVATDFNGWGGRYVPLMRRTTDGTVRSFGGGVSANFIQHGCSKQGEPGFPALKSEVSTWGHGDLVLNGSPKYRNLWMHAMYTNEYRDPATGIVWADESHTKVYNPKDCNEGDQAEDGRMAFTLVVARNCEDSNPDKIHRATDLDLVMSFA